MRKLLHLDEIRLRIGLEIHCQINLNTKLFSLARSVTNTIDQLNVKPNENVNIIDIAMPGTLPLLNKEAVIQGVKAALVLNCKINNVSFFDRKHYTFHDLPLGYQITQQRKPLGYDGVLYYSYQDGNNVVLNDSIKIQRLQIEQDSGKSIYSNDSLYTMIDFNRAGNSLIEVVFEPTLTSPYQAAGVVKTVQELLRHVNVCDGNMDQGLLRCDVNTSVEIVDKITNNVIEYGPKIEIKNLNSIQRLMSATLYEYERQSTYFMKKYNADTNTTLHSEVRGFDVDTMTTYHLRNKETNVDYRYMIDPDLPILYITDDELEQIRQNLPELPSFTIERLLRQYHLDTSQIGLLLTSKGSKKGNVGEVLYFYEKVCSYVSNKKSKIAHKEVFLWLTNELIGHIRSVNSWFSNPPITIEQFGAILIMIEENKITNAQAKKMLYLICQKNDKSVDPLLLATENRFKPADAISTNSLRLICETCVNDLKNTNQLRKYRGGNFGLLKYFLGEIMRETNGQFKPKDIESALIEILKEK